MINFIKKKKGCSKTDTADQSNVDAAEKLNGKVQRLTKKIEEALRPKENISIEISN